MSSPWPPPPPPSSPSSTQRPPQLSLGPPRRCQPGPAPSADPDPPHPHCPDWSPSPPSSRAAQCTMHRCWGAAGRARTRGAGDAPHARSPSRPPPSEPHTRPSVSIATASPAAASPILLTNQCAYVSSCRPALPSATLPALRAGLGSNARSQLGSRMQTKWGPAVQARAFPRPGTPKGTSRALLLLSRPDPDARSHLPLPPACAARPRQARPSRPLTRAWVC